MLNDRDTCTNVEFYNAVYNTKNTHLSTFESMDWFDFIFFSYIWYLQSDRHSIKMALAVPL